MKELTDDEKKRVNDIFNSWLELLDSRQQINDEIKDLIDEAANISEAKKPTIRKTFSFMKKKLEDDNPELDDISELAESLGV